MKSCVSIYIFLVMSIFHLTNTISEEENRIRKHFLAPEVETLPVSDWHNPSFEDYVLLENHIKQKVRDVIASPIENRCFQDSHLNNTLYGWITYRLYRLKFIDTKDNMPIRKTIYFNNDPQKKDRCVVCYAGYPMTGAEDRDYRRGITFIIDALNASHFDGHFIYQIGGWPNLQQGRLKYIDVPYAFKPFFLEEVRNLGYKQVLWIDTACIPVRNLDPIFNFIKTERLLLFFGRYHFRTDAYR